MRSGHHQRSPGHRRRRQGSPGCRRGSCGLVARRGPGFNPLGIEAVPGQIGTPRCAATVARSSDRRPGRDWPAAGLTDCPRTEHVGLFAPLRPAGRGPSLAAAYIPALWWARAEPVRRMLASGHLPPGSEPAEFQMVRRRSTVRFRKGAPRLGRLFERETGASPSGKCHPSGTRAAAQPAWRSPLAW
jgi:hypothetical protein